MKGVAPLILGIFGTFAFSWAGLVAIPNAQIGHLEPQMDEEGGDVYPAPESGLVERGRQVYIANGCIYCHSQQVRPGYGGSDIDREWGTRRSAPRDYVFERTALLGRMRMGPDLSNVGKRAPADDATAPPPAATEASASGQPPAPAPAPAEATSAPATAGPAPAPAPGGAPAAAAAPAPAGNAPAVPAAPTAAAAPAPPANAPAAPAPAAGGSPAPPPGGGSVVTPGSATAQEAPAGAPPAAPALPGPGAAASPAAATTAQSAVGGVGPTTTVVEGMPIPYTASWHHRHLYNPRSITSDSIMPAFRFLYETRRVTGERSADALQLTGEYAPEEGWEVVPSYDAKALVAYLMSLDQSHELKEVKGAAPATPPAPGATVK